MLYRRLHNERKDTKPYVSFCLVALPVSLSIDARCCLWSNSFDGNVGVMSLYRWFRYKCHTPSGRRNGASYDRAAVWRNKMRTHGTLILALGMWLILQRSLRCHSRTFLCRMGYANRTHACNGSCRHNADRNRNTLQQITPTHTFRLQFIAFILFVIHWVILHHPCYNYASMINSRRVIAPRVTKNASSLFREGVGRGEPK